MSKKPPHRPTKYKPEYDEQAKKLTLLGMTEVEMAKYFEVAESTITYWKTKNPSFSASLKDNREIADGEVTRKLYHRAIGHGGTVPDVTACIFWLKNRRPKDWRDKQDHEVYGKDGKDLAAPVQNVIVTKDSVDEALNRIRSDC